MKWIKWLLIIGGPVLGLFILGKFIFPEFTANSFYTVKGLLKPGQTSYTISESTISESSLPDSEEYKIIPLDKSQIQKMVKELIPTDTGSEEKKRKIVLSSPNEKIMKDFKVYLNSELPKGWVISRSTSDVDAIVTGNLFNLIPPKDPLGQEQTYEIFIEDEDGNPRQIVPVESTVESKKEPRHVLFLYWITETKEVLGATVNYENPNITAASENLAKNLTAKNLIEAEKSFKVALINMNNDSPMSSLITASILEKMVNAKTGLTFLDKSYIGKYDSELKKVLLSDNNQKVSHDYLAKKFSESTGANAALIISQPSQKHFYLELMELPSLDTLVIGRSENQPKK